MRDKLREWIKDYALVCIVLAIFLSLGAATYADYVKSSRTMRIVAAYGEQNDKFTSNFLAHRQNQEDNLRTAHVGRPVTPQGGGAAVSDTTVVVTICNHEQMGSSLPSGSAISYTVTASLKVEDNGVVRKAKRSDFESETTSLSLKLESGSESNFFENNVLRVDGNGDAVEISGLNATLPALVAEEHELRIRAVNAVQNCKHKLFLDIVALPSTGEAQLCGRIRLSEEVETKDPDWTGAFEWESNTPISNYDGFNYTITGYGAPAGRITLTWDPAVLTLNRAFVDFTLAKQYPSGTHYTYNAAGTLTFDVNSAAVARYDVQFYPVGVMSGFPDENDVSISFTAAS